PPLADLKRRLRDARIDTTTAVMNIKTTAPAGLTGAGLLMLHARPWIGTGAVALGVWGVWHGQRRIRRTLLSERPAASYLYRLETNLAPKDLAETRVPQFVVTRKPEFWG